MRINRDVRVKQLDDGTEENPAAKATRELLTAIRKGDFKAAQAAVIAGADIEAKRSGFPALHIALGNSQIDIVRLLLGRGADPNSLNPTGGGPLTTCAFDRQSDADAATMADLLVQHDADVNREVKGWTPLDCAINRNKAALQQALIARGGFSKYHHNA